MTSPSYWGHRTAASVTKSGMMEGRSSDRVPLAVRVLTASVVGFSTSSVLEGLLKASLPLTEVLKHASALKFQAESSFVVIQQQGKQVQHWHSVCHLVDVGFDENAHAQESQVGPCTDGRRGVLSQIPTRAVQADTLSHRPSPEGD